MVTDATDAPPPFAVTQVSVLQKANLHTSNQRTTIIALLRSCANSSIDDIYLESSISIYI